MSALENLFVIVPYYNVRNEWITECFCSISNLATSRPDIFIEIVIIDDASRIPLPNFEQLCSNPPSNLNYHVIHHEVNKGLGASRNSGLEFVLERGNEGFIVFLDGDDCLASLPTGNWDGVYIGEAIFFHHIWENKITSEGKLKLLSVNHIFNTLLFENPFPISSIILPVASVNGVRFENQICEDWLFWIRFFDRYVGNIWKSEIVFTAIRRPLQSMSSNYQVVFEGRAILFAKISHQTHNRLSKPFKAWQRSIVQFQLQAARSIIEQNKKVSFSYFFKGFLVIFAALLEGLYRYRALILMQIFLIFLLISPNFSRKILSFRYRFRRGRGGISKAYFDSSALHSKEVFSYEPASRGFLVFSKGRDAIHSLLSTIKGPHGNTILLPSYICREVVDAVVAAGAVIRWYDVDLSLKPINLFSTEASSFVLAVNYFGFPAEMEPFLKLQEKTGCFIIEDNAHGFLSVSSSGQLLGTRGDFSFTCFRKTFSRPSGCFLTMAKDYLDLFRVDSELPSLSRDENLREVIKDTIRRLATLFPPIYMYISYLVLKMSAVTRKASGLSLNTELVPKRASFGSSIRVPAWIRFLNPNKEVVRRRYLYERLECIAFEFNIKPLFPSLDSGIVPYVFPFFAGEESKNFDRFLKKIRSAGLLIQKWPDLPAIPERDIPDYYRNIYVVKLYW
jgi:glycosyltransferase involved in cell wall biosynthesis